jgi:ABC-type glycerol-3-phosphate transport system permease component
MKYLRALRDLLISLVASTIIIYAINIIAGFAGADYVFSHGETFIVWILMAILVNNCLKK